MKTAINLLILSINNYKFPPNITSIYDLFSLILLHKEIVHIKKLTKKILECHLLHQITPIISYKLSVKIRENLTKMLAESHLNPILKYGAHS